MMKNYSSNVLFGLHYLKRYFVLGILWLSCHYAVYAQSRTIMGKVLSEESQPLPGVSVSLKGTTTGTTTDASGKYSINVPSATAQLTFSFIGYTTETVTVGNQTEINVTLMPDINALSEVVVTALGIQREEKTLTYATQTLKPAQINEVRDGNVINTLQGKIAGSYITQGSGGAGSGSRIVLRGNRSIQQSNNALFVVDGVPINNSTNQVPSSDFGAVAGSDGASNINPDDIESMTILRGASAAALYGSQAANGVIVITTKKGKAGKITVDLNSGVSIENAFALPKVQNKYGQGVGGLLNVEKGESWGAEMTGQSYTNHLGNTSAYSPQPNNIKDFFRTATSFNNSLGISGGSEKMQTYLSYTNNSLQGVVPKNDLMRHTINLRLSNQISKRFSTDAKITYISQDIKNKPRTGEENAPVIDIYQIPRNVSLADAKQYSVINNVGISEPTPWPSTLSSIYQNPYWMINQTALNQTRDRVIGFLTAKYEITPWLNIQARANLDKYFDKNEESYSQGTILWATQAGGYFSRQNTINTQKWFDIILSGQNKINELFKIDYRAGAILLDNKFQSTGSYADGLNITNKFNLEFGTTLSNSDDFAHTQTQSIFGQGTISYKEAIFLDASIRNDWSSTLPKPYSFQYPSVGLSGIISELAHLPEAISFFKLNASYAQVGNGAEPYLLKTLYTYKQGSGYGFILRDGIQSISNLKPEITKSLEFGTDIRFLQNRIGITATYYKTNSTNQLLKLGLAPASGFSQQYINAGNIQNQGIEIVLNGTPVKSNNFTWDVTLNLGRNRNKIVSLDPNIKETTLGGSYARSATPIVREGESFGDLISYRWKKDEQGRYVVTAPNAEGNGGGLPVATTDQEIIGNFNPKLMLGLSNTFTYKGFSVRVLIDGRVGGIAVSGTEMNLAFSGITEATAQKREGGWILPGVTSTGEINDNAIDAQTFWTTVSGKRYGWGEFFAYDATNFRVREISAGYSFNLPSNLFIKSARLSFVARNLFWLYRGKSLLDIPGIGKRTMWFDPDMNLGNGNFQGVEYGTLPSTRSLGLNLKLSF
ncbi:SusC/RagA family TonB-linked outer membrane protein [Xanthocytophaga agilis]|uniref:SusC/RagA family TonB-linked outer membrane protein n=1 Tax=Xanthocytophaga agilis TaxID=3048010 RepID=A0AAE3UIK3_9BACT|nr:SusC/RagA family TonB-linked outer membrane protein [Xanthocytophaga agilis]MDJ1506700.1 SusC/RagA family TonB-linked outer membrane protein [Xanthocytophaga agilis]